MLPGILLGIFVAAGFIFGLLLFKYVKKEKKQGEDENKELRKKLNRIELDSVKSEGCENRIIELNNRIEEKQVRIESIDNEIKAKIGILTHVTLEGKYLDDLRKEYSAKLEKIQFERDSTADELKTLQEGLEASKTAMQELSRDIDNLRKEIKDLQEQKRLAILYQDENQKDQGELSIDDKEKSLISILERIKMDYPEIQMDISSIEGRKIGLPKLQDLCNEKDLDCKGIYRLILKSDESVCYVGQAQSIKDRGYQHVKKMIGVDAKGGEKLYKYRPEDFYGTVVERDCKDLNDREHYGIEYFGCKEIGLNKKA